jgi:hypothetical protein
MNKMAADEQRGRMQNECVTFSVKNGAQNNLGYISSTFLKKLSQS